MTRTSPMALLVLGVLGAAAGWLLEHLLTQGSRALLTPPILFSVVLTVLAAGVVILAIPVRRVAKGRPGARVDPFLAARVAIFAQATALTAAVLVGASLSVLVYVLSRPVVAPGVLWPTILGLASTIVLLAAALIAEEMCRIPPGQDGDQEVTDA